MPEDPTPNDRRAWNIIGPRVKEARRTSAPRLTQADLSARVEAYSIRLNRAGIAKIEAGKRSVTDYELKAIAAALYVPVAWLIGEDELYGSPEEIPPWPKPARSQRVRR